MKTKFTLLCLAALLFIGNASAQVNPSLANKLQNVLDSVCNKYRVKGTSVAVLIPGVGVWKGTNGVSEQGIPLTTDMLLGMGSNTKTHIAATLLLMQEKGLIDLDDSIGTWIQGYRNISGRITIRQCLNHTSGLFDYMQNEAINDSIFGKPEKLWTKREILGLALAPNAQPGGAWDYSNTNYIIAGIIIEEVLNKSPYAAMQELLFTPHQLNNTYHWADVPSNKTKATPWSMAMTGTELVNMNETGFLPNLFSLANTAGSLLTTAEDNVWFWHKLCTGKILNAQSWREMNTTVSIGSGDGYGLGIFRYSRKLNGRTFYSHGGTFFGYINENMHDTTSGVTIVALTNQDSMSNNGLLATVINALHRVTLTYQATGVLEQATVSTLACYPNPANQVVYLDENIPITDVQVMDLTGKVVMQTKYTHQLDVSALPNGLYMLVATDERNEKRYQQRLVVQHD